MDQMQSVTNGIDLVEIERFSRIDPKIKERFCRRVFTGKEIAAAENKDERYAGKFAAKEAAAKALGCGIGDINWHDLEIINDPKGKPILHLYGEAERLAREIGWVSWTVSITHTSITAAAVITALIET
jgi:holo-[acyl-carrier protein] synthase